MNTQEQFVQDILAGGTCSVNNDNPNRLLYTINNTTLSPAGYKWAKLAAESIRDSMSEQGEDVTQINIYLSNLP